MIFKDLVDIRGSWCIHLHHGPPRPGQKKQRAAHVEHDAHDAGVVGPREALLADLGTASTRRTCRLDGEAAPVQRLSSYLAVFTRFSFQLLHIKFSF